MFQVDPDPVFAAEIDNYISDDESDSTQLTSPLRPTTQSPSASIPRSTSSIAPAEYSNQKQKQNKNHTSTPNDSIHLHRQRLNRFHEGVKSFLSNVDAKSPPILVQHHSSGKDPKSLIDDSDSHRIHLDTLRLARFHQQAVSFLDRAYANEPSTLVTEESLSPAGLAAAHSRFHDRELLRSFHHEAMNFLQVAASATSLSPSPSSINKPTSISDINGSSNISSNRNTNRTADRTSLRIERDKARLEQHYQDAMSFLNRAEQGGGLVEEQELEDAAVERLQLQKYVREAMSFLDKAFRGDTSILVDDGDDAEIPLDDTSIVESNRVNSSPIDDISNQLIDKIRDDSQMSISKIGTSVDDDLYDRSRFYTSDRFDETSRNSSGKIIVTAQDDRAIVGFERAKSLPSKESPHQKIHPSNEEHRQILEDRAALERYDEEFGDFLTKAYDNESIIIVDDADSENSGTERGRLYARRMTHSTPSAQSSYSHEYSPQEEEEPDDEHLSDEVYTDDEFQDLTEKSREMIEVQYPRTVAPQIKRAVGDVVGDDNETLHLQMARYEREAADYLEGANVSEEEETDGAFIAQDFDGKLLKSSDSSMANQEQQILVSNEQAKLVFETRDSFEKNDEFQIIRESRHGILKGINEKRLDISEKKIADSFLSHEKEEVVIDEGSDDKKHWNVFKDIKNNMLVSPANAADGFRLGESVNADVRMGLRLEDQSGKSGDWRDVRLETSFYRQIPRGATIKLRAQASEESKDWKGRDDSGSASGGRIISVSALERVEKERDVLMATLEEIVNERSMLAAQVSEMKSIFPAGKILDRVPRRSSPSESGSASGMEDIDLAAELREAHSIMAKLTEEMEETLSILESRYQETLERAHNAEERCIRLESSTYRREAELASQGRRLAQALAEGRRLREVVEQTEEEFRSLRLKSEKDIQQIELEYRDEAERRGLRIRELNSEIAELQNKVEQETRQRRAISETDVKRLEAEVVSLKQKLTLNEQTLTAQKFETEAKSRKLEETHKQEKEKASEEFKRQLVVAEERVAAVEGEKARKEIRKLKSENVKLVDQLGEMGRKRVQAEKEIEEAKRLQRNAELEIGQIRTRFEESMNERISQLDQSAELLQLQEALDTLKEEAAKRERRLETQVEEVRGRAEQAEAAATAAEKDVKETTDMLTLVQERNRVAVETERATRQDAESEREALTAELERVNKLYQEQLNSTATADMASSGLSTSGSSGLGKSSSRRGIRSRNKDSDRKKKDSKPGDIGSEDGTQRKRSNHLHKLFGL